MVGRGAVVLKRLRWLLVLLWVGCGEPERVEPVEMVETVVAPAGDLVEPAEGLESPVVSALDMEPFAALAETLATLRGAERGTNEVLLVGERLLFEQDEQVLRVFDQVQLVTDEGWLRGDEMRAELDAEGALQRVVASGSVRGAQGGRSLEGDRLVYDWLAGVADLRGRAVIEEGGRRLAGEQVWVEGGVSGRLVCRPNAWLEIEQVGDRGGRMDIRAREVVIDRAARRVDFRERVRLRDERGAMNCEVLRLQLKEGWELDWLQAESGVVLQYGDVMAKASQLEYVEELGRAVLQGDPRLLQGRSVVRADRIQFWPVEQRVVGEPNARAVIFPDVEAWKQMRAELSADE